MPIVPLRWGILGTGVIAHTFAQALSATEAACLVAVGSRSGEAAERFAAGGGSIRAHPSYAGLIADPEVNAVYVATPPSTHKSYALMAIAAGKPVDVLTGFLDGKEQARGRPVGVISCRCRPLCGS